MAQIAYTEQMHCLSLIRVHESAAASLLAQAMELGQNPIPQRVVGPGEQVPPTLDEQKLMISELTSQSQMHALKLCEQSTRLISMVVINGKYVMGQKKAVTA